MVGLLFFWYSTLVTNDLTKQHCVPCEGGVDPLAGRDLELLLGSVKNWALVDGKKISKELKFNGFVEAMKFVNRVAEIAESEGHHPDIFISYNKVRFELTTHAIKGLSQNDFILAAKIDEITA